MYIGLLPAMASCVLFGYITNVCPQKKVHVNTKVQHSKLLDATKAGLLLKNKRIVMALTKGANCQMAETST